MKPCAIPTAPHPLDASRSSQSGSQAVKIGEDSRIANQPIRKVNSRENVRNLEANRVGCTKIFIVRHNPDLRINKQISK